MTLEEAVEIHISNKVHIYSSSGVCLDNRYELHFSRFAHDALFLFSYGDAGYKKWLLANARVVDTKEVTNE